MNIYISNGLLQANYVEVYGLFGEYLKTVVGDLIEDVDGTLAFSCLLDNIKLPQVTLKVSFHLENFFYIFSIPVIIIR